MLQRLSVENFALIDKLELELGDNLNIITGETGAGKSILLGALGLILGSRADNSSIKDQSRNCVIEGYFAVDGYSLESFFEDNDLDYQQNIIIRRVITPQGKSRAYVNDLPIGLTELKELGAKLIDIHSQHQTLIIGQESFRIGVLDAIAANGDLLTEYRMVFSELKRHQKELAELKSEADNSRKDEDYIRFQLEQLLSANLKEGELEELELEQTMLSNAEQIGVALGGSVDALEDEEFGILVKLKAVEQSLRKIEGVFSPSEDIANRAHSTLVELKDMVGELAQLNSRVEVDPARLDLVESRIGTIYGLFQKHKVERIEELIALRRDYESKLTGIDNFDEQIKALELKIDRGRESAEKIAAKITKSRKSAAKELEKHVVKILDRLSMPSTVVAVDFTSTNDLTSNGADQVVFMFSANKDMAAYPMDKVASGGELSRVMLAIKSLIVKSMKLPTIIFDEIDSGVSGRVADAMGEVIVDIADSMQVINITHLPQVACKGDNHFVVYKENSSTHIKHLDREQRVYEIAKMLSGSTITDHALNQAKQLLS